jgi:hypothetical protein
MHTVIHNKEQAAQACGRILAEDYESPKLLKLSDYKPPKTTQQVRYAHSIIGCIAKHNAISADKAKTDSKVAFGIINVETSCITGARAARLKSLADYTKIEIEVFITQIEHFCEENNIQYVRSKT